MGKALSFYRTTAIDFMKSKGYDFTFKNEHEYYFEDYFSQNGNPLDIMIQFTAEFTAEDENEEEDAGHIDFYLKSSTGVSILLDDVDLHGHHTQGMVLYDEFTKKQAATKKEFLKSLENDLKIIEKFHKDELAPKLLKDAIVRLHISGAEEWKKEYYWFIQNPEATWIMVRQAGMEDDLIQAVTIFGVDELMPPEAKDLFLF